MYFEIALLIPPSKKTINHKPINMKLSSSLCKLCLLQKDCSYIKEIREVSKKLFPAKNFTFKCDKYSKVFITGDIVEVQFTEKQEGSNDNEYREPVLIKKTHIGVITGVVYKNKYQVKFLKAIFVPDAGFVGDQCWRISKHLKPTGVNIYKGEFWGKSSEAIKYHRSQLIKN